MSRYELNHWQFNSSARMSFFRNLGSARKYVSHIQWPFFYILILWLRRLCQLHLTLRPFTTFFFSAFFCSLLFDDKEKCISWRDFFGHLLLSIDNNFRLLLKRGKLFVSHRSWRTRNKWKEITGVAVRC